MGTPWILAADAPGTTTTPSETDGGGAASSFDATDVLVFGGVALVLVAALQLARMFLADSPKGSPITSNFIRLFGLILVSTLGVALVFADNVSEAVSSGAFTLLGAVAGYLAGAKATLPGSQEGTGGTGVTEGTGGTGGTGGGPKESSERRREKRS